MARPGIEPEVGHGPTDGTRRDVQAHNAPTPLAREDGPRPGRGTGAVMARRRSARQRAPAPELALLAGAAASRVAACAVAWAAQKAWTAADDPMIELLNSLNVVMQ